MNRHRPAVSLFPGRLLAAALIALSLAGACGEDPNRNGGPAQASGLVVLTQDGGKTRLTTYDAGGATQAIRAPDGAVAWMSAGRRGTIIATMADGTLRLSDRIRADRDATWKRVPGPQADMPDDPVWFATWAPNGDRFAAIATPDFSQDGALSLVVVDALGATSLIWRVPGKPLPAPPTWLDDGRVLVQATGGSVVLVVDSGDMAGGPDLDGEVELVDVSADGARAAVGRTGNGPVEVRRRDEWLAGSGRPEASLGADGSVGAVALDRRAERLAVIRESSGGAGTLLIYRRTGEWREVARLALPNDSARGVLAWMP